MSFFGRVQQNSLFDLTLKSGLTYVISDNSPEIFPERGSPKKHNGRGTSVRTMTR